MKLLLVSYDLKIPGQDYKTLYDLLKNTGYWWHYLDSTWLIATNEDAESLASRIHRALDTNDSFIVFDVTQSARQGWLPKKAWQWFEKMEST